MIMVPNKEETIPSLMELSQSTLPVTKVEGEGAVGISTV